jgi:hypothetical protein
MHCWKKLKIHRWERSQSGKSDDGSIIVS